MSDIEDLVFVNHDDDVDDVNIHSTLKGGEIPQLTDESDKNRQETTTSTGKGTRPLLSVVDGRPHSVQIVSIEGNEGSYRFQFHKEKLDAILGLIPPEYLVAVVSVVGAFRTGKSFLLSWFLRFLTYSDGKGDDDNAHDDDGHPWYKAFTSLGNDGFEWKGGSERNTTGIWMWSHAHLNHQDKVATLLVDTQGMFDHETTMNLTASIFGFSTLLSSYQIYNVDKRVQEDHLQQLALFSEYARAAVGNSSSSDSSTTSPPTTTVPPAPFQHVEFLVRDWQHFDVSEDEDDSLDNVDYDSLEQGLVEYLNQVLQERQAKDLRETREQISACFEHISCYGLCHPGFAVTKKKYTGDVTALEPLFLRLLDRYCHRVFEQVKPKTIHGRTVTAAELGAFVQVYADLFATANKFPTAATLLAATAQANNTNAVQLALSDYMKDMDRVAGTNCSSYLNVEELVQEHQRAVDRSLEHFDSVATFGARTGIEDAREKLVKELIKQYETYKALNDGRNPLAGLETFVLPMTIGLVSMVMRWLTDLTCDAHFCRATSHVFGNTSAVVFSFLAIMAATKAKHIHAFIQRLRKALDVLSDNSTKTQPMKRKED